MARAAGSRQPTQEPPDHLTGHLKGQPPDQVTGLYLTSLSHLRDTRLRRMLRLAGYVPRIGTPQKGEAIAVWGHRPTAKRGEALAERTGAPLIRLEDPFLRSLHPGRARGLFGRTTGALGPMGLIMDHSGIYYDASRPSDLETMLASDPLDHADDLARARAVIHQLRDADLSKYSAYDPAAAVPEPGYVLVIDQTRDDASIRLGGANAHHFDEALTEARLDHPTARIVIKGHPEARLGLRPGHFSPETEGLDPRITYFDAPASPWRLLDGAIAVYVVTSQMGFEAILAGHRPQVFGQPFYAGWNLTEDRANAIPRRGRRLTRAQLVLAALIRYPLWYDPLSDALCPIEGALATFEADTRAWRDSHRGAMITGARLWKRGTLARFQRHGRLSFDDTAQRALRSAKHRQQPLHIWAGKETAEVNTAAVIDDIALARVEDGFLRSAGLGAALVPPLSLVWDRSGIYYDPTRPSDLEGAIARAARAPIEGLRRARALRDTVLAGNLSKYNLSAMPLPSGDLEQAAAQRAAGRQVVLIPGQVADDASIRLGATGSVTTNAGLLAAARTAFPDAFLIYKPHPDVEAGLREGALSQAEEAHADLVLRDTPIAALWPVIDRVWTLTSLTGFEALLRNIPVSTLGSPFYAGWGLTDDRDLLPAAAARRASARPNLDALIHAALIAYPRYCDPLSGLPCGPELTVARLRSGTATAPSLGLKLLSKAQGALAGQSWLWRR